MPRSATKKDPPSKAGTKRRLDFEEEESPSETKRRAKPSPAPTTRSVHNEKAATITTATSLDSFMSPISKKSEARQAKVVTPEEEKKQDDDTVTSTFVPKYIHKNLLYYCQGDTKMDPINQQAYQHVVESHHVPTDLEQSRSYGPKAGSTYEDRVLTAYALGRLKPRDDYEGETRICLACAKKGHKRDE